METTRITLENENGIYSVEVNKTCMNAADMFSDLLAPALLAAGYSRDNIEEWQV